MKPTKQNEQRNKANYRAMIIRLSRRKTKQYESTTISETQKRHCHSRQ